MDNLQKLVRLWEMILCAGYIAVVDHFVPV